MDIKAGEEREVCKEQHRKHNGLGIARQAKAGISDYHGTAPYTAANQNK
jgi:hypothetical protein